MTSRHTKAELFAEAQRRRVLLAPGDDAGRARRRWSTCASAATGRRSTAGPAPARSCTRRPGRCRRSAPPPAVGEHTSGRGDRDVPPAGRRVGGPTARSRSPGSRSSTSRGCSPARWRPACSPTSAPPSSRSRGPTHPDASRGGGGALQGRPRPRGQRRLRPLQLRQAEPQPRPHERGRRATSCATSSAGPTCSSSRSRPGVMDAWGLGHEALRAINPRLVMLSTSLMGQTGPLSTFAGFGNLAGAITGFYELTGWPDRAPGRAVPRLHRLRRPEVHARRPARRPRLAPPHRVRAVPRPVAGRGVDPLPRPGDPRPHRQRHPPDADGQRRPLPPPPRRVPRAPATTRGWPSPARTTTQRAALAGVVGALDDDADRGVDGGPHGGRDRAGRCRPSACRSTACRTATPAGPTRSSSTATTT